MERAYVAVVCSVLALAACAGRSSGVAALPVGSHARTARSSPVTEKLLYSFSGEPDGSAPGAGLKSLNGKFFGTTSAGGSGCSSVGCGTIFSVSSAGTEHVLYRFAGGTDGATPESALSEVGGKLFGTTERGGTYNSGVVYDVTTGGTESILHSFGNSEDGYAPAGKLVNVGGALYGTTSFGGAHSQGAIFKITTEGSESVLHSFSGGSDGSAPSGDLTLVGDSLYGTTTAGGASFGCPTAGCGTVFKITTFGVFAVLYRFRGGHDGVGPSTQLVYFNGALYGGTSAGGTNTCPYQTGCGTIFRVTTAGKERVISNFSKGSKGYSPDALMTANGVLYGATAYGGDDRCPAGCGTIFEMTPSGTEQMLHAFHGRPTDGKLPNPPLLYEDGTLYGTTEEGGTSNAGTVFSLTP